MLRTELDVLTDFADLVDAAVAGAVDLEHVHVLAGGDAAAAVADAAGRDGRPLFAVERLGEDAGGGGFADAAGAGEEVGVGDAVAGDGVAEGLGDGLLPDQVAEQLRPVAAGGRRP